MRPNTMPRTPKITPAHRTKFLAALTAGKNRSEAAREAHKDLTGTAFKNLEGRDDRFAAQITEAERRGIDARAERISAEFDRRAFDEKKPSLRALEILAATYHPDYAWLRRRGAQTADGDQLGLTPMVDPDLLTRGQLELLVELVEMGQGKRPNAELDAERRGLPSGDVIDGEATEEEEEAA